ETNSTITYEKMNNGLFNPGIHSRGKKRSHDTVSSVSDTHNQSDADDNGSISEPPTTSNCCNCDELRKLLNLLDNRVKRLEQIARINRTSYYRKPD
ncbi:unnamed protein product, partial [Didymodactylos carnosus]